MTLAPSIALSPDGTAIAYTCARGGATQLCLRRLDRPGVSPIAGTEGGRYPNFSPDGRSVVFCVAARHSYCEAGGSSAPPLVADRARGEVSVALTAMLPDGGWMIFTVSGRIGASGSPRFGC